jgi:hypothetical protein
LKQSGQHFGDCFVLTVYKVLLSYIEHHAVTSDTAWVH